MMEEAKTEDYDKKEKASGDGKGELMGTGLSLCFTSRK